MALATTSSSSRKNKTLRAITMNAQETINDQWSIWYSKPQTDEDGNVYDVWYPLTNQPDSLESCLALVQRLQKTYPNFCTHYRIIHIDDQDFVVDMYRTTYIERYRPSVFQIALSLREEGKGFISAHLLAHDEYND